MMINGPNHGEFTENMQRCHDYIKALEKERQKIIQAFRRELPLCLELVTQAIDTCKHQLSATTTTPHYNPRGQSECSEQTSSDVPVFEEFIPMKRASSDFGSEDKESAKSKNDLSEKNCKKSDWLRCVQLWSQIPDAPSKDDSSRKFSDRNGGGSDGDGDAFDPFKKERGVAGNGPARGAAAASTSSMAESGGGKKEGRSPRKARRCWSSELHRRFLQVLQQLGGPHVATPKQIRELMKVDGLTNDEVKSHLQKYRLHTRRPIPSTRNKNAQTPQFVAVGGLWMPAALGRSASKEIYAPVSAPPLPPSCSPASSSSTHLITAVSPAC